MIKSFTILIMVITISNGQKINLNTDDLSKMHTLDLSIDQINEIIDYRERTGKIDDIYELLAISNISIQDIHAIKSSVTIEKTQSTSFEKDMQRAWNIEQRI